VVAVFVRRTSKPQASFKKNLRNFLPTINSAT